MLPRVLAFALVGICVLPACGAGWRGHGDTFYGHSFPRKRAEAETTYKFGLPGGAWQPLPELKDLQVAWMNRQLDGTGLIELHAQCDEQGDSSLYEYADHLRIDLTAWKVVEQQEVRLADRAALRTVVDAELDGVMRRNEFWLVKKNGCLFDLRYSSAPQSFDRGLPDFRRVVEGFRFPVRAS